MRKKGFIQFLVMILIVGMLAACGGGNSANQNEPTPQQPEQSVENDTKADEEATTRIITDQAGREVELPLEVNRVITTWRPSSVLLFAINGQEKLVAADTHSTKNEFLQGIYPEIADIPGVGNRKGLNVEEMVKAKPEVVFIWQGEDTKHLIDQLEEQGIAVFVLVPETGEDMKEAVLLMGEVINQEAQAKKAIDYYNDTVAMIADRIKDVPEEERPVVYLAGSGGFLNTMGKEYYQHSIIEQAGGINAGAELEGTGFQEVSQEQLVAWNPDYMFATQFVEDDIVDFVKSNPGLHNIDAVKNDRLYKFPANNTSWDFPEPLSIMGVLWLAKTLYPDQFADIDINETVEQYHEEFFGKSFTELGGNLDESKALSIK